METEKKVTKKKRATRKKAPGGSVTVADSGVVEHALTLTFSEAEWYLLTDCQKKWRIKNVTDLVGFALTALGVAPVGGLLVQFEDGKIQRILPPPNLCEEEGLEQVTWH